MKNKLFKSYFTLKIDLKMKITTLFLFVALFQLQANNSYSQKSPISLDMENATIGSVLNEIEKKTDFNILYKNSALDLDKKISVNVKKMKIEELMNLILKETNMTFEIRRKLIVLIEKKKTSQLENDPLFKTLENKTEQNTTITGLVTDQSQVPLPGVSIVIKGTTKGVSTNFDGVYKIQASYGDVLVFSYLGFKTTEVTVAQNTTINLAMTPNFSELP
ncbi:carboxypeptidase-like regulatory domain-containing protein [Mariniflexile sp.]|uniref:carboxypeptidase-like regulatory domain-containing protein n=1 Tax=Mariniflexile sp. TaxID=1979402 RepID=UPI00404866A7